MASLRLRLLEWFADSSPRVQYPVPRDPRPAPPRFRLVWRYPMPLIERIGLFALSLALALFALGALAAMLVFASELL